MKKAHINEIKHRRQEIDEKRGVASVVKNKIEKLCQELPMEAGDISGPVADIIKKYNKQN